MRNKRNLFALGILLASAVPGMSQTVIQLPVPSMVNDPKPVATQNELKSATEPKIPPTIDPVQPTTTVFDTQTWPCTRFWVRTEYLLWWLKDQPAQPLFATNPTGGAPLIGTPGAEIRYGDSDIDAGHFSGVRTSLGGTLNRNPNVGWEASGFLLESRSPTFIFASAADGSPNSALLTVDPLDGTPSGTTVSSTGFSTGFLSIANFTRLWGAEFDGLFLVRQRPTWNLNLISGFKYLDLSEKLDLYNPFSILGSGSGDILENHFHTRNQFYGGQLGARGSYQSGRLSVDLVGKVALGVSHETVNNFGQDVTFAPGGAVTAVRDVALYVGPNNKGTRNEDFFAVVPQFEIRVAMDVTQRLRASVGYDFLYWSRVARPGDQVDRSTFFTPTAEFGPRERFESGDFFAHGVNFGVEYRW